MSDDDIVSLIERGLAERDRDDIRGHHCSLCGGAGHTKRTCGQTPLERAQKQHRRRP